jgi:hypothetical protein
MKVSPLSPPLPPAAAIVVVVAGAVLRVVAHIPSQSFSG